ncbi:unnamed protein product, partial [Closterium sp. NIES-53]
MILPCSQSPSPSGLSTSWLCHVASWTARCTAAWRSPAPCPPRGQPCPMLMLLLLLLLLLLPPFCGRFEYELALSCGELDRALHCLMALSRPMSASGAAVADADAAMDSQMDSTGILAMAASQAKECGTFNANAAMDSQMDSTGILTMAASPANMMEAAVGVARYASDFLDLVDAADATGQADVAVRALRQLAGASLLEGALLPAVQRRVSLRLALHGEGTRLQ